jgi:hypothetical protein
MIMFYLDNYSYPGDKEVNKINEYGRRVFMPFCDDKNECKLVADKIFIKCEGETLPFSISEINGNLNLDDRQCVPNYIKSFLFRDAEAERIYSIRHIIGDRMFVACIFHNASVSKKLCEWDIETENYKYISDALKYSPSSHDNAAAIFYKLMCIDTDDATCQSRSMLKKYNEEHGYHRWGEYGTVYGITEYSMVAILNSYIEHIWDAFLYEYVEMVTIVLAQRATFLALENEVNALILCGAKSGDLDSLQEKHLVFQSKLLLKEITSQQQGIELYEALSTHLIINEKKMNFDKSIIALDAFGNLKEEKRKSGILFWITLLGILNFVSPLAEIIFSIRDNMLNWFKIFGTLLLCVIFFIWTQYKRKYFKHK